MTRVKGLAFASLFVLALSAQPVLSQDRNSNLPPPTSRGTTADAPPPSPNAQNDPTARPPRQRTDGDHQQRNGQSHRRKPNGDPSQAQGSDGRTNGNNRQGPPPGGHSSQGSSGTTR